MYTEFEAIESKKLSEDLKILQCSDTSSDEFNVALKDYFNILDKSRPATPERVVSWAREVVQAYREIGRAIQNMEKIKQLRSEIIEEELEALFQHNEKILEPSASGTSLDRLKETIIYLQKISKRYEGFIQQYTLKEGTFLDAINHTLEDYEYINEKLGNFHVDDLLETRKNLEKLSQGI
jgi:hypothetical protein